MHTKIATEFVSEQGFRSAAAFVAPKCFNHRRTMRQLYFRHGSFDWKARNNLYMACTAITRRLAFKIPYQSIVADIRVSVVREGLNEN